MGRRQVRLVAAACLVALAAAAGAGGAVAGATRSASSSSTSTLVVTFNQDGSVSVALGDGTPVGTPAPPGTLIAAGTYQVVVNNPYRDDTSVTHEFAISGPGVDLVTDMNEGEEQQGSWIETFQPSSTYTYEDTLRPASIYGVFQTTSSSSASVTPSPGASASGGETSSNVPSVGAGLTTSSATSRAAPLRGTLSASVSAAGGLALRFRGRGVATLRAGRYRIEVTDRSATSGFMLQEIHSPPITLTGAAFVGTRSLTVDLSAGQWLFYASLVAKKSYFEVTA